MLAVHHAVQDGEMLHEKAITFLRALFRRWKALAVSHSLSIVLFCRCYYCENRLRRGAAFTRGPSATDDSSASAESMDADCSGREHARNDRKQVHCEELTMDGSGRRYADFYKLVAENESRSDWEPMLPTLKRHLLSFAASRRRREPTTSSLPGGAEVAGTRRSRRSLYACRESQGDLSACGDRSSPVVDKAEASTDSASGATVTCCKAVNSTAAHGNLLEAINLALDVLETTQEEVNLASTGKSIVVLSAGSGWFDVDYKLSQVSR